MDELINSLLPLALFVAFMTLGLATIPLDVWLERRRERRYDQAHKIRRES
jgi:hypothetical protein